MPVISTVFLWLSKDTAFSEQYARAREAQAEALLEDILEIADDGTNDTYLDENGNPRTDHDVVARSRLRVDTRKWAMSKLKPRRYGEKIDINHSGSIETMTEEQVDARLAELLGKAGIAGPASAKAAAGTDEQA